MWNGVDRSYQPTSSETEGVTQQQSAEEEHTAEDQNDNADENKKSWLYQEVVDLDQGHAEGVEDEEKISEMSIPECQSEQTEDKSTSTIFNGKSFNGMRVWYLSTYTCQEMMREILKNRNPFGKSDEHLRKLLRLEDRKTKFESECKQLYNMHKDCLYKSDISYEHLDVTLMYVIARNFLTDEILIQPSIWNTKPLKSDFSLQACVDKLRQFRNHISHIELSHVPADDEFQQKCRDIKQVFEAVEKCIGLQPTYGRKVDRIMYACKPTDVEKLEKELLEAGNRKGDDQYKQVIESLEGRLQEIITEFEKLNNNLGGQEAQTKMLIENHEVEERFYVETKLSKKAWELLQKHHHILITGGKGCGKTALSYHLMFRLLKFSEKCKVYNIHSISEFLNNIDPRGFVITLVEISEIRPESDPASLKKVIREFIDSDQQTGLYIIMTSGLENVTKIANLTNQVDLADPEDDSLCLGYQEKLSLVQKQLERFSEKHDKSVNEMTLENIARVSKNPIPFPLAAFLFAKNERFRKFGADFFRSPVVYYREEIKRCSERNANTIILLALLFEEKPISFTEEQILKIKQRLSGYEYGQSLCKEKHMEQLQDAAEYLETEELVTSVKKKFTLKNTTVKKAVISFAVERFLKLSIWNLNQETLCDTAVFKCTGQQGMNCPLLHEPHKDILASRFFEDMINDHTAALHRSDAWVDPYFIERIMVLCKTHCNKEPDLLDACIKRLLEWSVRYRCLPLCEAIERFLRGYEDERRIATMTSYLLRTCETINSTFHVVEKEFKAADILQFFVSAGARCSYCTCSEDSDTRDHSFPLRWVLNTNDEECLHILLKAGAQDPHSRWGFWSLLAAAAQEEETMMCTSSFVKMQCSNYVEKDGHEIDGNLVQLGIGVKMLEDDSDENKKSMISCCIKTIGLSQKLLKAMQRQHFPILEKDENENNYLHFALSSSTPSDTMSETISALTNEPALLSCKNMEEQTPLGMAVLQVKCGIKCIAKLSEKCTKETRTEALYHCVQSEIEDNIVSQRVSEMIRHGVNPNEVVKDGRSSIQAVISKGKSRIKTLGILAKCKHASDSHATDFMLHYCITLDLNNTDKEHVIEVLIKEGADVNQQNDEGATPIMLAIKEAKDNLGLVDLLLKNGADKNMTDTEGLLPLHYCCLADMESNVAVDMVDLLLTDDELKETPAKHTPLMLAIMNKKHPDLLMKLVDIYFDVGRTDSDGKTVLHLLVHSTLEDDTVLAVAKKCLRKFDEICLENNEDISEDSRHAYRQHENVFGRCLLHACVESSMSDESTSSLCQILIERGASVTEEDYQNRNTPLTLAASSRCNRVKTICTLLKASSMVMTDGLLEIIKEKNKLTSDLLTSLLCNEIAIEDECKEKMTPFYIKEEFSEEVEANIVGPLRKLGFDLDSRTNSGDTVLLSACKSRCKATLLAELAKFSSMNNKEPYLPLIVMSDRSDEDTKLCIEAILTEEKPPIDQMNEIHRTAVIESVRKRKQNTLKHLLASGASPNMRDRFGKTALHYCVESEMFDDEVCDILSILFETKPKVDIKDNKRKDSIKSSGMSCNKISNSDI
ncbi:uncharacterized protein LOC117344596 [Pecten maximus]|uniref:uncharacterized protein LOC117344596 n=1 Tax=Pecten maximus TaxID=6579 RepID=UPI001458C8B4|nr:uncharacterized protein LOC117344596 [Pecten maximus]